MRRPPTPRQARLPGHAWRQLRRRILDARGWRCQRCQLPGALELHHVDGDPSHNAPANLQVLCRSCHIAAHRPPEAPEVAAWRRLVDSMADL